MSRSGRIVVGEEGGSDDDHEEYDVIPDIYFEVDGQSGVRTWHIIKFSQARGGVSMKLMKDSKIPEFPDDALGGGSAAAVIGSKIYVSGGYVSNICHCKYDSHRYNTALSSRVYYVDAHDPYPQWEQAPPMLNIRGDHYKFAYDGKLYALSGCTGGVYVGKYRETLFAEVYDPNSTQGWKEIARISADTHHFIHIYGHAVVRHGSDTKILFHTYRSNYIHGILLGSPRIFGTDYPFPHTAFASAFVDGVFYYLDDSKDIQELYAFDINEPLGGHKRVKFVNKKRKGCLPYLCENDPWDKAPTCPTTHLLSLGNKNLAVIWARSEFYFDPGLRVYCSILEVSKKEGNSFEAKVLGYSNYIMKQGSLGCCVSMPPRHEDAVLRLPRSGDAVSTLPRCANVGQITEGSIEQWNHLKKRKREELVKRGNK